MIQFTPGSQVWQLITMLSFVGEFPHQSRQLLGNKDVYKNLISKLTRPQTFINTTTGATMTCWVLSVSGKGQERTIRLYKGALPILEWIHPNATRYYMHAFRNHHFSGDASHWERNHRVAEVAAVCMHAGIEARPYRLPRLQNEQFNSVIPSEAVMYLAKDLKKLSEDELNKTAFTRMVGALFAGNTCYALYNTRGAVMKWSGMGEFKTMTSLTSIASLNAGISRVQSAILIGQSESVALNTLMESDKSKRHEFRFDSIYRHIHFMPLTDKGVRQLRLFSVPDWKEKLLDLLFEPEDRAYNQGLFEYDALVNGVYVYSHLDGDIARLIRFKEALDKQFGSIEVLCYPHQISFLREYLGRRVRIKTIDMDLVETELGPERRNLFER